MRLNANITPAEMDILRAYARRKGISLTEAAERAGRALTYVSGAQDRGAVVQVREPDGQLRDVVFLL